MRTPSSTRTDTRVPYTTLFRSASWQPGGSHQERRRRGDLRQDRGGAVARPAGGDDRAADTLSRRNRPLCRGSPGVDRTATVISRPLRRRGTSRTPALPPPTRLPFAFPLGRAPQARRCKTDTRQSPPLNAPPPHTRAPPPHPPPHQPP